jgi:hypothetical protein
MQAFAITSLQMKVSMLEDLHDLIQDMIAELVWSNIISTGSDLACTDGISTTLAPHSE